MASHGRQHAGTAYPPLRCHSRLRCTEAMSAAISSPFTSLASHCIWCTRRTRLVPRIRSLALRTSPNRPRIRTIFVVLHQNQSRCNAPGSAICLVAAARAPHGRHSWPRLPRPIGVYRGHEGDDNGQSIRAIGSALHLAYQQAAGAPDVALSSPTSASRRVARIKTRAAAMRPAAPFAL